MSLDHITIYLEQKLHRLGSGPQVGQTVSGINVTAHYGSMSESGPNKRATVEKMVRQLRKLYAEGKIKADVNPAQKFHSFDKCIIPEAVLALSVEDFIDWNLIKTESSEE